MDVFQAIKNRRSVRKFLDKPVPEEVVKEILDAARMAPTGGNMQPWEFLIVRDPDLKSRLVDSTYTGYLANSGKPQRWILGAPVVIGVFANMKRSGARYGEHGKVIALMDVSAAIENLLLAATALGLGACWVSGFDSEKLKKIVQSPPELEPVALIPVGFPDKVPSEPPKLPLEEVVHPEGFA